MRTEAESIDLEIGPRALEAMWLENNGSTYWREAQIVGRPRRQRQSWASGHDRTTPPNMTPAQMIRALVQEGLAENAEEARIMLVDMGEIEDDSE